VINQKVLPNRLEFNKVKDYETVIRFINDMTVRGAPAIGVFGACGIYLAAKKFKSKNVNLFKNYIRKVANKIINTRPTANNLKWAIERVLNAIEFKNININDAVEKIYLELQKLIEEDIETNKKIGEYGYEIIKNFSRVMTHCNAGSFATVYYGTALAPVYKIKEKNKNINVVITETRPKLQGARITAFELKLAQIPYEIISDTMVGYYMKKNLVDAVIVGADRIALNGDTANKIGTYQLAILAKYHNIPFYVAAPTSTFDINSKNANDIPIEYRSPKEVMYINEVLITPKRSKIWNPAFDITPANLITAFITERGIIKPDIESIKNILNG
ncbi:MAG: S-methyl-5-thioribose-1-phosphate isomerase, partial [bacterium]|nr:S-methyl-5-thioribose-1-phosphate isomerase [bacterium]